MPLEKTIFIPKYMPLGQKTPMDYYLKSINGNAVVLTTKSRDAMKINKFDILSKCCILLERQNISYRVLG
jgi:hypothetical protein